MIGWVDAMCRSWGYARFKIDTDESSPTSIWGRMSEGWSIAAAEHSQRPDPPEVMVGNALEISIAIKNAIQAKELTERQFRVLYVHYSERAATKRKISTLKVSRKNYYELLNRAHRVLRRHLPPEHSHKDDETMDGRCWRVPGDNLTELGRNPVPSKTRFEVLKRDGFKCKYCGASPPDVVLQVDHVVALANGGTNASDNLVAACAECNFGKGADPLTVTGDKKSKREVA